MRALLPAYALAALFCGFGLSAADAAPFRQGPAPQMTTSPAPMQTQYRCDDRGCRPTRGGYYQPRGPYDGRGYSHPYARSRPGQLTPPAGMTWQEYEAHRAGSGGG
ncbi:MAG: hypothetical protein K0S06_2644 [Microvirga sp.]|jgi:hypothetical protein|nr:hypothetical protein [Microvirga sp.]